MPNNTNHVARRTGSHPPTSRPTTAAATTASATSQGVMVLHSARRSSTPKISGQRRSASAVNR